MVGFKSHYILKAINFKSLSRAKMENVSAVWFRSAMDSTSREEGIAFCCAFVLEAALVVVTNTFVVVLFVFERKLRKKSIINITAGNCSVYVTFILMVTLYPQTQIVQNDESIM